ncbi:glycosyltransferase family 4 protein [Mucilaginibacter pallidiroseus]|uniref:Glycosyltransferase family 4 protein n=1 Tax=Mucilaginibacter pallidiroseus TaxID=2599295 RepID=A0A563U8C8_9SPHI|nr:glycosyltransferase [Mucilaginibacter pallidiroseus]TWR27573.1 glycosyltransferase family 4 protein [Mucilaginibacter pallidiroseus]
MKLLSYQPFSLYANGGGNRILRRLYQGHEDKVISLVVDQSGAGPGKGKVPETIILATPVIQSWARWHVRTFITWLRFKVFRSATIQKIQAAAQQFDHDVLHVVDHSPFSAALCSSAAACAKPLWVSFHDHFNTTQGSYKNSFTLWTRASRRLVISEELGLEYQRLFGKQSFELITDGVKDQEINLAAPANNDVKLIYFAGLLHIAYMPLFAVLADALDALTANGYKFKLILRGTQNLAFLSARSFEVDYRPTTLDNNQLKTELDASDMLYLPIKFSNPDFYLYSLSTKMVGYLGAPGSILYHGPADSAACNLLSKNQAAVCSTSLDKQKVAEDILHLITNGQVVSANAKKLAAERFDMDRIQKRFWQE